MAKIKCKFGFGSIFGQFVSNRDIGSLHLVHASGTMLNNCLCISYFGWSVAFGTTCTVVTFSQCWHTVHAKYLIHTFCVYVFVLCVLVVLFFRHQALEWVMVPDSTGLYVGLVG